MRQVSISINTTGYEYIIGHRIIEVGCVELIDGDLTGAYFHYYINPDREIGDSTIEKTGITNEFLGDKPKFSEIKCKLLEFLINAELVVYDAPNALGFLNNEFKLADPNFTSIENDHSIIDILKISRKNFPQSDNNLYELAKRLFVNVSMVEFSGALLNSEIMADVYLSLTSSTLKEIIELHSQEEGTYVNTFTEFIEATDGVSRTALCRGVSNKDYLLLPSLFRNNAKTDADTIEDKLMWVFKTHAKAFLPILPMSEVEWLTVAQHHGLPTRLLDWSLSPLVACFFAVKSLSKSSATVYIYDIGNFMKEEDVNLKRLDNIVAFFPSHATKRITSQSGMFTIHPSNIPKAF